MAHKLVYMWVGKMEAMMALMKVCMMVGSLEYSWVARKELERVSTTAVVKVGW